MRQIHPNGRGLSQYRERRCAFEQLAPDAQRVVIGMAGAEHPLVAADAAHAAAHLIGKRLEGERAITGGERARDGRARAAPVERGEEGIERFLEAALQQVGVAVERDQRARIGARPQRNMKAVNGVEEEQGAYALVEVVAGAAETIELAAGFEQLVERRAAAQRFERGVAVGAGGDDVDEAAHRWLPPASNSTSCESTCARSGPLSASAVCATSSP